VISTLRSEWIKLRTIRMNWVLVAIALAFPLAVSALFVAFAEVGSFDGADVFGLLSFTTVVTTMLLGVVGATTITGEYGFNTIRPTFAATPNRLRVILAKMLVVIVVGIVTTAVVVVAGLSLCTAIASARDVDIDLGAVDGLVEASVGLVVFGTILTVFGLALGSIVRSTPAAVAALILWPLLVENIVSGILGAVGIDNVSKWMPYGAGTQLWTLDSPDAIGGLTEGLGRVGGGLYFGGVVVALLLVGCVFVSRRDA
jgi:ABC-2 type transport system permease protein